MAKGRQRSSKEARKTKDPDKAGRKRAGPKYLREAEVLQVGNVNLKRLGQK
jgi:hypothetical protein